MVRTRSQCDAADVDEERRQSELERQRIGAERVRRSSRDPPASPSAVQSTATATVPSSMPYRTMEMPTSAATDVTVASYSGLIAARREEPRPRPTSPVRSERSHRSTASVTARVRLAELEAAEKLAAIKRKELEIEAELVRRQLAADVSLLQEEKESVQGEPVPSDVSQQRISEGLQTNSLPSRGEEMSERRPETKQIRFEQQPRRERSLTPPRAAWNAIDKLADSIDKMARPRPRYAEIPRFSGAPSEWLPFKAAMRDSTVMYNITPAENIQRLRTSLHGEAKDVVSSLLNTATDPDIIMKTLEQCFGRPEMIVDRAIEDLKKLPKPGTSAVELNKFAVKIQNIICVLQTIDKKGYLYNPTLAQEVLEKHSPHICTRWSEYAEQQVEREGIPEPEIIVLSRFLTLQANWALKHTYVPRKATTTTTTSRPTTTVTKRKATVYNTTEKHEERKDSCPRCEQDHVLTSCPKYKEMTVDQRWQLVKEKGVCFKCAQKKHRRFHCRAKPCGVNDCRRPHHQSLHSDEAKTEGRAKIADTPKEEAVLSVASKPIISGKKTVMLKMCPVVIAGPRGKKNTFALLDEGATITLIDEGLAADVGAEGPSQPLRLNGVNMSQSEAESQLVEIKIQGIREDEEYPVRARTMKNLKLHQQAIPSCMLNFNHLKDLNKEEVCYEAARPGILVGADHWECIVSRELRIGEPDQPAASKTRLGWVVHGTAPRSIICEEGNVLHVFEPTKREMNPSDRELHELVEKHFQIEALGVRPKPRVNEVDQRAIAIVERTTAKVHNGYEVGLPWRRDNVTMPASYSQAFRRLKKVEEKMDTNPTFKKEYTREIENLLEKGYAKPCDGTEESSPIKWFLPHFAVVNPNKPGKCRLVFDAAARSNGVSLNDELLEGPDLLLSLPGIVFKFREKAIAISADIQEMFLQIKIRPQDQPAQQFLWRGENRDKPPQKFKMTSMIFGAASSPYMAHYVRNKNADIHGKEFPRALEAIKNEHYMDDWVASYENAEEARRAIAETRTVHAQAGFTLRGWSSNDRTVLEEVPADLHATAPARLGGEKPENKILGLYWNAERDELGFNTSMNRVPEEVRTRERAPTKREALSAVMSIYDPLGLLSHYTIRSKIILQSLWRLRTAWDEQIPDEENELFASWLARLPEIATLRLPRCYTLNGHERIDLHVLCNASEQAYATAAYWRMANNDGTIRVVLVAAKAKVAPKKSQTIPRLELQAALIGARLAETIKKEHRIEVGQTTYWTDSSTVIHWIKNDTRRYTPFIAHRLGEIAELTQRQEWRWIPTDHNVADDATRLIDAPISSTDRWFQGPGFLYSPEDQWPSKMTVGDTEEEVLHVSETPRGQSWLPDPTRFSKYETLVRAAAGVLAFVDICRRRATRLEHRHIERAEVKLIQRVQEDSFHDELARIRSGRPLPRSSRLYRLDPLIEDEVLRVRGRIGASAAPSDTKRPVILDGRHPITKLLVLREHCAAGHANRERVTNDLRQRYWVIHLRPTVRATERNCALCQKRRAAPQTPATGDLPHARLDPFHRPFTNCGVDYFGPMVVKVGRRREKRWGALFTCLTSRAVHIEIVASLSTDSAIMALRRMAARRGWPRLMYSDNGTNFRGADQELRAAYKEWLPALRDEGLLHRMEWRFIPPGAPNQGGAWERMMRSVKTALSATLKEKTPAEEVLLTLLTEAEFSVNARPLTHVSVNPDDPEALTPNHFLLGSSTGMPTTGPCDEADRRTWRASMALADYFWRRWTREYLPTLVPRGEPKNDARPLQVGDVVLIVDSTLPRNTWPMGLVKRTHPGLDGSVRVVEVQTRTGVFRRPVSKLAVVLKREGYASCAGGRAVADNELAVENTM